MATPAQKVARAKARLVRPSEAGARLPGARLPKTLPAHVAPFAEFMRRAAGDPPTNRKIVKAYAMTRASVARGALKRPTVCLTYPEFRELRRFAATAGEDVRPEDAMAILLFGPHGKKYLNAAGRGEFDAAAADEMVKRARCFGLQNTLRADLRRGVELARHHGDELRHVLRSGSREEWIDFIRSKRVPGISAAKAGFFAALFGRGDLPTFDARELDLWRRKPRARRTVRKADVLALEERIAESGFRVPARFKAQRQHLAHHALWDAAGRSRTTHAVIAHAMQFAGVAKRRRR
jgi:hypothetical protein